MVGAAAAGDVADTATDAAGMQVAAGMRATGMSAEHAVELQLAGVAHR